MRTSRAKKGEAFLGLGLILPALAVLLAFHIVPLLYVGVLSFRASDGGGWTLDQYGKCLRAAPDGDRGTAPFLQALSVTAYYAAGVVPVSLGLGLLVAVLLSGELRGRAIYRTIYFLPFATSAVAAAAAWRWIFHREAWGIANSLLARFGTNPVPWTEESRGVFEILWGKLGLAAPLPFAGPSVALVTCMAFAVWQSLGFNVVVFLAGLSRIPRELYEAARVDGAGSWTILWKITFPLLGPTTFLLCVVMTISSFQAFSHIFIMAPSQWDQSARNVALLIFEQIWQEHDYNFAAAVATMLFLILLLLTAIQFRVVGPRVHYR
ncbi:MAG: sugar ABC transporter permease [Planctomycetota bacterium]